MSVVSRHFLALDDLVPKELLQSTALLFGIVYRIAGETAGIGFDQTSCREPQKYRQLRSIDLGTTVFRQSGSLIQFDSLEWLLET